MRFGAHVSISGKIYQAVERGVHIGCECLQIFVGNPRQWRPATYPAEDLARFRQARAAAGLDPLVAHTPYLINLAAPAALIHRRSTAALISALRTMEALDGLGAITHAGSCMGAPWPAARRRIARALREALAATSSAMILLENSAGSGEHIGASFRELREILDALDDHPRLGICLDTCHLFAAGWDLRAPDGVDAMVAAFDAAVGWDRARALHLNDSMAPLGSHVDRHENIGKGEIGLAGFRAVVTHPTLQHLPGFIETPGFNRTGPDRRNLNILKRLRAPAATRERQGGRLSKTK